MARIPGVRERGRSGMICTDISIAYFVPMPNNRHIVLRQRPAGPIDPDHFDLLRCRRPEPAPGQAVLAVEWLAMDPYLRSVIAGRHLGAALAPGERMPGQGIARVIEAPADGPVQPGDPVVTDCGWTEWVARPAEQLRRLELPDGVPPQTALGILGMPGLTAWAGLHRVAAIKPGEVVAVSSASGTVGAAVLQLARAHGCITIGITSETKLDYVKEELGADFVLSRTGDLPARLAAGDIPRFDVAFDNTGGEVLAAMLDHLALHARVVLCGLMAQYEQSERPPGPNLGPVIGARASLHGLVVYDHFDALPEFLATALPLYRPGRLRCHETVYQGLDQAPEAFCALMSGASHGRVLVRLKQ